MKLIQKGERYSLFQNKENYLIIKKGSVYFAIQKTDITKKNILEVFNNYQGNLEIVDRIMDIYE